MNMSVTKFAQLVYSTLEKCVPPGNVITYTQLAKLVGRPTAVRAIGNILHNNPFAPIIPCHRVVNKTGQLAKNFGSNGKISDQRARLLKENVVFKAVYTVDLNKSGLNI